MALSKEYKEYAKKAYSTFFALCEELGPDEVWRRYYDENMRIRDDAPQALKDEMALMDAERAEWLSYQTDGEVVR